MCTISPQRFVIPGIAKEAVDRGDGPFSKGSTFLRESGGWDYIWAASGELHDCPELVSLLAINSVPWRCRGGVRWCCRGATGVAAGAAAVATGAATGMIPVGIASCVSSIWDDGAA